MATAQKTNEKIVQIITKYMSKKDAVEMLRELQEVEGNKSFKTSIQRLNLLLEFG